MMKSVRFLVVTAVVSMVLAYVIAPPDPWTYRYPLRVLVILLAVIPTYLIGRAHGRESQKGGQVGGGIWLQFSIRALLLGTALFAIFLGVYCERARRQMYFREALEASGAEVFYESEFDGTPWSNMKMQGLIAGKTPRPPRLTWLRELLGAITSILSWRSLSEPVVSKTQSRFSRTCLICGRFISRQAVLSRCPRTKPEPLNETPKS